MDTYDDARHTHSGATTQFAQVKEQQDKLSFSDLDNLSTLGFSDISLSELLDQIDRQNGNSGKSERQSYSGNQNCAFPQDNPHIDVTDECPRKRTNQTARKHNLTEKRRRDKIKGKMKVLQELIPNSQKLDRASLLDKAISRIKTLQWQRDQIFQAMNSYRYIVPTPLPYTTTGLSPCASPMSSNMGFGTGLNANLTTIQSHLALGMIPYNLPFWRSVSGNFMPMPSLQTNPYFQPPAASTYSMQPQYTSDISPLAYFQGHHQSSDQDMK